MSDTDSPPVRPGRGRPRSADKRRVVQRLLAATELLLREQNHFDLTERKIAAAAETHEAMIHYYFGGKDGLLFEVICNYYLEINAGFKALDDVDLESKSITRDIFSIMIDAYYAKPWMVRVVVSEMARGDSAIKAFYMEKFGSQGLGLARLRSLFERLVERRIYTAQVNTAQAALGMFAMIVAPCMLAPFSGGTSLELDEMKNKDGWIDYVADLFDRQLRTL